MVPISVNAATTSIPPPGWTSSATPAKPTTIPRIAMGESRRPNTNRSSTATQSGTIATINAANPESSRVSAQATPPFPRRSRAPPTIAAARHSCHVGRARPRLANAYSAIPATANRTADISSGGIVRSVTRIARYVEPQTT